MLSSLQASSVQLALSQRCKTWRRAAVDDGLWVERSRPHEGLLHRNLGVGVGLCTQACLGTLSKSRSERAVKSQLTRATCTGAGLRVLSMRLRSTEGGWGDKQHEDQRLSRLLTLFPVPTALLLIMQCCSLVVSPLCAWLSWC